MAVNITNRQQEETTMNQTRTLVYDQNGARGYRLGSSGSLELVELELAPGACIPDHALPFPVTFHIQQGTPSLSLPPHAERVATPGETLDVASHALRGWHNNSETPAQILVIKQLTIHSTQEP
jgi:quercetin dioxygenase-like cupin family protein